MNVRGGAAAPTGYVLAPPKPSREQLEESAERYQRLVDLSPDGIAVHSEGRLVFVNPAGARLLGASDPAQLVGMPITAVVHPDSQKLVADRVEAMRAGRSVPVVEEKFVRLDGRTIDVEVAGAPLDYRGKPAVLVICRDVTERKRLEQLRDQYVQAVSHDLRTPLAAILARGQLLERRLAAGDVAAAAASAEAIVASAQRMARMLDDMREAARIEGGRATPDVQPVALGAFLEEMLARNAGGIDVERVRLAIDTQIPPVRADPERLERVVLNLISNGLKYSPPGRPVRVGAEAHGGDVVVSIADEGGGIPSEVASHVFDRFFRAPGARQEGLGLGLYIARGLVEAQGGHIWVESEPSKGATFYFSLPRA